MSITTRLWNQKDLEQIQNDRWLATVFMNGHTFSKDEIRYYPYNIRKQYHATWYDTEEEPLTFYATDDKMAIKFLKSEYIRLPDTLQEILTTRREVKLS
jgi:hypothetical protein